MSHVITVLHFRYSKGSSTLCSEPNSDYCSGFNPGNQTTFYIEVMADSNSSDVRDATLKFTNGNIANVTDVNTTTLSPATLPTTSKFLNKHTIKK